MKKIFIQIFGTFLCFLSNQIFSQNSIETNPTGTLGLINSKGIGTTNHFLGGRANVYATTGNISTTNNVTAIYGIANNSTTTNYGLIGVANGTSNFGIGVYGSSTGVNSQNSIGVSGYSNVLNGTGLGVQGRVEMNSVASDRGFGGHFGSITSSGVNGGASSYGVVAYSEGTGGVSTRIGLRATAIGTATDFSYGIFGQARNDGNATTYGGYFLADGTGSGTKYGIYAKASDNGNLYAAILDGKVGIGTSTVSTNEILEINGRTRIRRNALPAGIWFNNNANGNSVSDGAFVGMNNETPGSESVGFFLSNSFRFTVDRIGNASVSNNLNVANSITVDNTLNVGNTLTVTNNLAASGGITVGGGQVINKIIKVRLTGLLPSFSGNDFTTQTYTVNGATVGDVVVMTPESSVGTQIIISEVYVSANNTVTIRYYKPTSGSTFPGATYAFNFVVYK